MKHVKITLNSVEEEKFDAIKDYIGCNSNAEVFRILMNKEHKKIAKQEAAIQ